MTPALALASLLSLQLAQAEAIARIDGVHSTFPDTGDSILRPRNLRPLAFGSFPTPPIFTLTRSDTSVVIVEAAPVDAAFNGGFDATRIFALTLPALTPGEDVVLEATCEGCPVIDSGLTFAIGDTTDDVTPAFGPGGRFTFVGGVGGNGVFGRTGFEVEVCLPALTTPEDVVVRFDGTALPAPILSLASAGCTDGGDGLATLFLIEGGDERSLCVDAVAIDAAGHESAPTTVCGDLIDQDTGCAAARIPAPLPLLALALFARRRRR